MWSSALAVRGSLARTLGPLAPAAPAMARRTLRLRIAPTALLSLARADCGDALRQWNLELRLRPRGVIEVRYRHARERAAHRAFDRGNLALLLRRDECERLPRRFR